MFSRLQCITWVSLQGLGACEATKIVSLYERAVVKNSRQISRFLKMWRGSHAPVDAGYLKPDLCERSLTKRCQGILLWPRDRTDLQTDKAWGFQQDRQRRPGRSDGQQSRCLVSWAGNLFLIAACVSQRFTTQREARHGFPVSSGTFAEGAISPRPVILSRGTNFSCSDDRDAQKITPLTEMLAGPEVSKGPQAVSGSHRTSSGRSR